MFSTTSSLFLMITLMISAEALEEESKENDKPFTPFYCQLATFYHESGKPFQTKDATTVWKLKKSWKNRYETGKNHEKIIRENYQRMTKNDMKNKDYFLSLKKSFWKNAFFKENKKCLVTSTWKERPIFFLLRSTQVLYV